jgi:hypothetical protein
VPGNWAKDWRNSPNITRLVVLSVGWILISDVCTWKTRSFASSRRFLPVCSPGLAMQELRRVTVLIESGLFQLSQSGETRGTQCCNCWARVRSGVRCLFHARGLRGFKASPDNMLVPFAAFLSSSRASSPYSTIMPRLSPCPLIYLTVFVKK